MIGITMKSEKEIRQTYEDCLSAIKDYELSSEGGDLINKGWIEALEYVLNTTERSENGKQSK